MHFNVIGPALQGFAISFNLRSKARPLLLTMTAFDSKAINLQPKFNKIYLEEFDYSFLINAHNP